MAERIYSTIGYLMIVLSGGGLALIGVGVWTMDWRWAVTGLLLWVALALALALGVCAMIRDDK